jgi:hypothetical protein
MVTWAKVNWRKNPVGGHLCFLCVTADVKLTHIVGVILTRLGEDGGLFAGDA